MMMLGLSFTAISLWSFYDDFVKLYKLGDVAYLEDVAIYMSTPLLVVTLISIGLNVLPTIFKRK